MRRHVCLSCFARRLADERQDALHAVLRLGVGRFAVEPEPIVGKPLVKANPGASGEARQGHRQTGHGGILFAAAGLAPVLRQSHVGVCHGNGFAHGALSLSSDDSGLSAATRVEKPSNPAALQAERIASPTSVDGASARTLPPPPAPVSLAP